MIKRAFLVRMKGLEPIRLTAPDPKSGLATNYNTSAAQLFKFSKYSNFLRILNLSHLSNSQIPRTFFCPRYPSPKSSPSGRGLTLATRAQKWCFALAKLESIPKDCKVTHIFLICKSASAPISQKHPVYHLVCKAPREWVPGRFVSIGRFLEHRPGRDCVKRVLIEW